MRLDELADKINATVHGDPAGDVSSVATLESAAAGQLSFLANPKYGKFLDTTRATAVIAGRKIRSERLTVLAADNPYYAFSRAVELLHGGRKHPFAGVHPRATVDASATIGEGTIVYPGAFVGPGVIVGRECVIYPNVAIYERVRIGDRVIVHANSSIGLDGYGFATHEGVHHKIAQIGSCVIEDDVEIGSGCAIQRGALEDTIIGKGTKIDSLVVIGHGTRIGANCLIVAHVGIAGSVTIGKNVTLAGQVGVAGHLQIGDGVTVGAQGGVITDAEAGMTLIGSPAMPAQHARRVYTIFTKLPELADRVKLLEQRLESLDDDHDAMPLV